MSIDPVQLVLFSLTCVCGTAGALPVEHLMLDLDAAQGVQQDAHGRVLCWTNQVADSAAKHFVPNDQGREVPGSGMPSYQEAGADRPFPAVRFQRQELVNADEDAFDSLIHGSGHTWYAVLAVDEQLSSAKNTHAFFGNLRNTHAVDGGTGGAFEGFWGVVMDDRSIYAGVRNGVEFERNSSNNPEVVSHTQLKTQRFYLVAGRMGAGTGTVPVEVFVNQAVAESTASVVVHPEADSSKMAIGQERDATNHPGAESFDGELARLLIYDTAHSLAEMEAVLAQFIENYAIMTAQ
jgi:hypothetical protein